jgi:hypothetical protein
MLSRARSAGPAPVRGPGGGGGATAAADGSAGAAGGGSGAPGAVTSRSLVVLAAGAGIFQLVRWLDAEPLLACVTAGMVAANRR